MQFRRSVLWFTAIILVVAAPALAQQGNAVVRFDNHKLVRVHVQSADQIQQIHALGAMLMNDAEGVGMVDYLVPPDALTGLAALGVSYKVLNDNIQKDIDAERTRLAAAGAVDARDPTWFNDYKTIAQVNARLNAMAVDRPDLASVFDIGTTLQGNHIYGIRISSAGTGKPAVLFNGCHHAREWISVMVPMWIADKLVYDYDTDPTIHSLVDRVEFFIIPVVNVDGYIYTWTTYRLWRKNRRLNADGSYGVDDNRNYDAGWGGEGSSTIPSDETYCGTAPFSEAETQAMRNFAIAHPQIVASQSYHSYSQLFMSSYGYKSALPADNDTLMEIDKTSHDLILAVHGTQYDYGPIYSTIYPASGGDVDWYYDHEGIFSFTTELRDTGTYGFQLPAAQIIPTCEENFPPAEYLADWSASPLKISFPNGLPSRLTPNTAQTVRVKFMVVGGALDPNSPRLYSRVGDSGAFAESTLTSLGGGLYDATLPATWCGLTRSYYFSAATTTAVVGLSPANAPDTLYRATATSILTVLDQNMDTNPGWIKSPNSAANQWAWGHPTGGGGAYGGPDPANGFTGTNVMGYNLAGDYANSLAEMSITTGPINCTGLSGVKLSFYRWLGVEQPLYDHAYVRVSNNGSTYSNVWQNTATTYDGAWVYQECDISAYANNKASVTIRWTMGTSDGAWQYCGWNIDDVKVWASDPSPCPLQPGDLNCDGVVGFKDINPFVQALSNPSSYAATYPGCDILHGDANGDGSVNFKDINPFVTLLTQ